MDDPGRHTIETASGALVASSYFWLHTVNEAVGMLAGLAGLIYMLLKIWQVVRELRAVRQPRSPG